MADLKFAEQQFATCHFVIIAERCFQPFYTRCDGKRFTNLSDMTPQLGVSLKGTNSEDLAGCPCAQARIFITVEIAPRKLHFSRGRKPQPVEAWAKRVDDFASKKSPLS